MWVALQEHKMTAVKTIISLMGYVVKAGLIPGRMKRFFSLPQS
jgi:hypothetical protein